MVDDVLFDELVVGGNVGEIVVQFGGCIDNLEIDVVVLVVGFEYGGFVKFGEDVFGCWFLCCSENDFFCDFYVVCGCSVFGESFVYCQCVV